MRRRSKNRSKQKLLNDPRYIEFCIRYRHSLFRYALEVGDVQPTWQQAQLLKAIEKPGARVACSSGHGCFGRGTKVLMYGGTVKPVEMVCVGDQLMGDDGTPRNVLELKRGREELYRFEYMDAKEDGSYNIFNKSHILCLVTTQSHGSQVKGDYCEVTVRDWLNWSDRKRRTHAIYRKPVGFNKSRRLKIPPYILGVWLGDGTLKAPVITNPDPEIISEITKYCSDNNYSLRLTDDSGIHYWIGCGYSKKRGFLAKLRSYGLQGFKHIPLEYKTSSINERLELLAGLLDTDGYLDKRNMRVFEITQKNKVLANDIVWVARSVGLHASIKEVQKSCSYNGSKKWGTYYRVNISRNIEIIPTRISRKKAQAIKNPQRSNLHFGIRSVSELGEGEYFGFVLDGNQKFLGGDFTVLHNTGKSKVYATAIDWHLKIYPFSNTLLTANNINQCRSVVWKELDTVIYSSNNLFPFLAGNFIKETKRYYCKGYKDSWFAIPKTAAKYKPESIAGMHNKNYLALVDEASAIEDEILEVLRGGLTEERNRFAMISQYTRTNGHFHDAFTSLTDIYETMQFNSEESPLVSKAFIRECLITYGGHHSPEYQIRVLGRRADNLSGFLIPLGWCEDAQKIEFEHVEDWGWVITADVGEGVYRDSSVMNVGKVSGYGDMRAVEPVYLREFLDLDPKQFALIIWEKYQELPNCTIAVDSDGPGLATALDLEDLGANVVRIHWGRPPHSQEDKKRYQDQRAYACVEARKAIFDGRMKLAKGKKSAEQASKIPYSFDKRGRYVIAPKSQMLKSPDIFDTHCFFFLCDYIPCGESISQVQEDDMLKWAKAILEGEENE